jgi:hypothetical protein
LSSSKQKPGVYGSLGGLMKKADFVDTGKFDRSPTKEASSSKAESTVGVGTGDVCPYKSKLVDKILKDLEAKDCQRPIKKSSKR